MLRILVTLFNAERFVGRCLRSIAGQEVKEWRCYVMDDVSTDRSGEAVRRACGGDRRFHYLRNREKQYQCGNYHRVIQGHGFDPEDICVAIDADDWLGDAKVFTRLLRAYEERPTCVSWGSCLYRTLGGLRVTHHGPLADGTPLRQAPWTPFHMRAWKVSLWRRIDERDLKDPSGEFWKVSGDQAFMYPMIEMAGPAARFLADKGYCYNRSNPLCNHHLRREQQLRNDHLIRGMAPYRPCLLDLDSVPVAG
jgi:glycosyltransferase involved in cell wall biosynthesis